MKTGLNVFETTSRFKNKNYDPPKKYFDKAAEFISEIGLREAA
jgi:hypothetical protein